MKRVLTAGLAALMGCAPIVGPQNFLERCPIPVPMDTSNYAVTGKDQYFHLCKLRAQLNFQETYQLDACITLWNDNNMAHLMSEPFQIIHVDWSKCNQGMDWAFPEFPNPFPGPSPTYPSREGP